jgi:hypothetical protein
MSAPAITVDMPDTIKGMFCDLVARLEALAPRALIINAMARALETERTVDAMIAAADADETPEK